MSLSLNLYALSALLAVVGDIVIAVIVLLFGKDKKLSIAYALMSLTIATWAFCCFVQSTLLHISAITLFSDKLLYTSAAIAPIAYLYLVLSIRAAPKATYRQLAWLFALALPFIVINWIDPLRTQWFISGLDLRYGFRLASVPLPGWYWFAAVYTLSSCFSLSHLVIGYHQASLQEKSRYQILLIATSILATGGFLYFLLIANIQFPQIDNLLHFSYAVLMAFAISKYSLLEIKLAVSTGFKKASTFFVLSATSKLISFSLIATIGALLYQFSNEFFSYQAITILLLSIYLFAAIDRYQWLVTTIKKPTSTLLTGTYMNVPDKLKQLDTLLSDKFRTEEIINLSSKFLSDAIDGASVKILLQGNQTPLSPFSTPPNQLISTLDHPQCDLLAFHNAKAISPLFQNQTLIGLILIYGDQRSLSAFEIDLLTQTTHLLEQKFQIQKSFDDDQKLLSKSLKISSMLSHMNHYNHELKNILYMPYQTSIFQEDLIKEGLLDTEKAYQDITKTIQNASDRATKLIKKMVDVIQGKTERQLEAINLSQLVKTCLSDFQIKGIAIQQNLATKLPLIQGDKQDLEILILNIIKNAQEALLTQPQAQREKRNAPSKITITTQHHPSNNSISLHIQDNGPGLSKAALSAWQQHQSFSSKLSGSGIGLQTIRQIVDDHGGSLTIRSDEGVGACVEILFGGEDID